MFKKITPEKKIIVSLCLAIVSILPVVFLFLYFFSPWGRIFKIFGNILVTFPLHLLGILTSSSGVIFGIQGLKSTKKFLATISITFAIVNLFLLIISLYVYVLIFEIGQR
ncbi:MAG: hypothetical protein COS76_00470 [Candidatus Portnoybacteria bacterium CG06_land_8_20_14_3_00_39_12]|uniref:Uncharacterized protein n=1 Tax=Candidatus Portnoybacteria bacterium CG06_land_8_20_14_3_00_39_12 TaxID=1974809 RepID=A0A2M7AXZ1_9BACT|nr:MAG: hypothetical protein COS76_00470 [Candidatus Portnoybacteria bacterium CG06_land_8_20_14_3_00_39_12]